MIVVIEGNNGYSIANNGQTLARLTDTEADALRTALNETLRPLSTGAVSPAKARLMRYPIKTK